MPGSINNIAVSYDAINEKNTFSEGDVISGRVLVVTTKDTKVKQLMVKVGGVADVHWTEHHGDNAVHYHAKDKCLKLDQILLKPQNGEESITIAAGANVYPFIFQIPPGSLPSSFKGVHGKIEYKVKTKLSRSLRIPSRSSSMFTFVSKSEMANPQLRQPQYGTITKKMRVFTSGSASVNVCLDRMGFLLGEGIQLRAEIGNDSSRALTPKFAVYQKQSFFAGRSRNLHTKQILKEVGQPIPSKTKQTVTHVLRMPADLPASIQNCKILKVEYKVKVYLDVPYAKDPVIKLPVLILPYECADGLTIQPGALSDFTAYGNPVVDEKQAPAFPPPQIYPPFPAVQTNPLYPVPGVYVPPNVPLNPPPYSVMGQFPPPTLPVASDVPPPYSAIGQLPPQTLPTAPQAPPPYNALSQFPAPTAPAHAGFGMYPSLSDAEEKKPL